MTNPTPLQARHETDEAAFIPFGEDVRVVGTFGAVEVEYGAIHRTAAIMDCPHRGLIRVTGDDRLDFLHRMLSRDCGSLEPGRGDRMVLLTDKGHIMADMVVLHDADRTWIDLDLPSVDDVVSEFDRLLFAEDVQLENVSGQYHRLSVHGPHALADHHDDLADYAHQPSRGGFMFRFDQLGVPGAHFWLPPDDVAVAYDELLSDETHKSLGWLGYNIARIEAGRPMFRVDFGPDSLPHETGIVSELVSFTKGCYRGQEVVARIEARGHPSKVLVKFAAEADDVPVAETPVRHSDGEIVGAVTSSTFSPLRSNKPIGFAMVKWAHHEPGTALTVPTMEGDVEIIVEALS